MARRVTKLHAAEITSGPGGDWAKVTCIIPLAVLPLVEQAMERYEQIVLDSDLAMHYPGPVLNGQLLEALVAEFLAGPDPAAQPDIVIPAWPELRTAP